MFRILFTFFLLPFFFAQSLFAQADEKSNQIAAVKYNLAEFRDPSVWMSRRALTRFSSDGKYLAVSAKSADVVVYKIDDGSIVSKIDGHGFIAFSFSPDSKYVVAQDAGDYQMRVFETETGKMVREIRGLGDLANVEKTLGGGGILNMAMGVSPDAPIQMSEVPISPDWKDILVNKNDKEFDVYDFDTGKFKYELEHAKYSGTWETTKFVFMALGALGGNPAGLMMPGTSSNSQYSPDGKYIVIANGNKNPTLWSSETGKLLNKFDFKQRIFYFKFSPDSKMVATSDFRGILRVTNIETGELLSSIGERKDMRSIANWSKNSDKLFALPGFLRKGDLKAYNPKTGEMLYSFDKSDTWSAFLSHNSQYVVTIPRNNKAFYFQIWNGETGALIASIPRQKTKKQLTSVRWSPDDSIIATTAGLKNEVELWNTKGELLQTLQNAVFPVEFSNDEKYILTGGRIKENQRESDMGYLWEIKKGN